MNWHETITKKMHVKKFAEKLPFPIKNELCVLSVKRLIVKPTTIKWRKHLAINEKFRYYNSRNNNNNFHEVLLNIYYAILTWNQFKMKWNRFLLVFVKRRIVLRNLLRGWAAGYMKFHNKFKVCLSPLCLSVYLSFCLYFLIGTYMYIQFSSDLG